MTHTGVPSATPRPIASTRGPVGPSLDRNDHMASEISEQPEAAARVLEEICGEIANGSLWRNLGLPAFERLRVVACGTSLNAGAVIGDALWRLGGVGTTLVVASEAAGRVVEPDTLTLTISQSGETVDVLRAVDEGPDGAPVLALVNNLHSTLARTVDAVIGCSAGQEVGVAATKTFVCQVLVGTGLMISALVDSGRISRDRARDLVDDMLGIPDRLAVSASLALNELPSVIQETKNANGFIFIARGAGVPYAMEGALKLKELAYRWAEAYPAGELKHGPLALVEPGTPVIAVDNGDPRLAGNVEEVMARGGQIISVGRSGSRLHTPLSALAPCGPVETVVPLQLLALNLAAELGFDVDKPRSLAKSTAVG